MTKRIVISDDAGPLEHEIGGLLLAGEREAAVKRLEEEYARLMPASEYDEDLTDAA